MNETFVLKSELRAALRREVAALTEQYRAAAARSIAAAIEVSARFATARTVAAFVPLADEVPLREALAGWCSARRVVVPRVEGDTMRFFEYRPEALHRGAFGIDEPVGTDECRPSEIDVMIVPGIAFTPNGGRMGRGRGYYDRYLSQPEAARIHRIGVCFRCQLRRELPLEPHDIAMDEVAAG